MGVTRDARYPPSVDVDAVGDDRDRDVGPNKTADRVRRGVAHRSEDNIGTHPARDPIEESRSG